MGGRGKCRRCMVNVVFDTFTSPTKTSTEELHKKSASGWMGREQKPVLSIAYSNQRLGANLIKLFKPKDTFTNINMLFLRKYLVRILGHYPQKYLQSNFFIETQSVI